MKFKPFVLFAALAVSITLLSELTFAKESNEYVKEIVYMFEGKEYHATGVNSESVVHGPNAIELEADPAKIAAEERRGNDIAKLKEIIKAAAAEYDAGSYIDEERNIVFQLTAVDSVLEKKLLAAFPKEARSKNQSKISA